MIRTLFNGTLIGIANIIPGVSGGTMAIILGIYDRLINDLCNFTPQVPKEFLWAIKSENKGQNLNKLWQKLDLTFLSLLMVGALIAIKILSNVITFFLDQYHDPTYGFFFGLILISIWVPYKMLNQKSWWDVLPLLVGVALPVVLTLSLQSKELANIAPSSSSLFYIFICGVLAISAMILPGVSGSFLLILLGVYFEIIKAIHLLDLPILATFAVGCILGLLVFVRFLQFIMKKYYSGTIAFLIGLMLGSLWNVWPFKYSTVIGEKRVFLENYLPSTLNMNLVITICSAIVAGLLVAILIKVDVKLIEKKEKRGDN